MMLLYTFYFFLTTFYITIHFKSVCGHFLEDFCTSCFAFVRLLTHQSHLWVGICQLLFTGEQRLFLFLVFFGSLNAK
jgi:hypothetical protein